jgi:hypothetical protein
MQADRGSRIKEGAVCALLAGVVLGWNAHWAAAQVDDGAVTGSALGDAPVDVAAKAQASASDLATSLSWVAGSMEAAEPAAAMADGQLSKAENDALVESAAKAQLAGMATELDQLSAALASGQDPAATKTLLLSLRRRGATLNQLGQRTDQALIPTALQAELMMLWRDVEKLSANGKVAATPTAELETEIPQQ